MPDQMFENSAALNRITEFYEDQRSVRNEDICKVNIATESNEQEKCSAMEMILKLPKSVQTCFAALIEYLKDFKLERILRLTRYVYVGCSCKAVHVSVITSWSQLVNSSITNNP